MTLDAKRKKKNETVSILLGTSNDLKIRGNRKRNESEHDVTRLPRRNLMQKEEIH
jgi:hypothetical protein